MIVNGTVENVIFRNDDNGYTVLKVKTSSNLITVSGRFPLVGEGELLEIEGEFKDVPKYGNQFIAESVKVFKPKDVDSIFNYLSSGLIRGVGEVTAKNIVDKFKEDTLKVIEEDYAKLASVKGISMKKALEIHNCYENIKKMQESVMFMQKYDISIGTAVKIYKQYKEKTEQVLTSNPYTLIEDIDGIGFKTADKIASKLGIKHDSEIRIKAGIIFALNEIAEKQGSTIALLDSLKQSAMNVLELDESLLDKLEDCLVDLEIFGTIKKQIFEEKEAVAVSKYYKMENYIADKLISLDSNANVEKLGTEQDIEQYEILNQITLHEKQRQAVLAGTSGGVTIITGGPGTGKTTIIKAILSIFKASRKKCMLMAPTGRASKRMEEQTKEPASTIHRALGSNGRGFIKDENNPLDADVIIIDEVSMLDVQLMYYFLKAVQLGTRLIFVGDKDQLPSVGAGNILADMIASDVFEVVELSQIYRQSEDSMIAQNAHKINNCEMPDLKKKSSDFFFSSISDPEQVANEIVELVCSRMPKYFDFLKPEDIQIIAPMKAGVAGVDNLNVLVQQKYNPEGPNKRQITLQKRVFREGDKVMQIVNNYDRDWEKIEAGGYPVYGSGVFNGDMGVIEEIIPDTNEMYVMFDDGRRACYSYAELEEIVLSYAITIHKSQGSEFPAVIIPIMGGSPLLMNKNLLYTAVTRAKKIVVLIGKSSNVYYMVNNKLSSSRNTNLKKMLERKVNLGGGFDLGL